MLRLRKYFSKKPTRVFRFRYERADGEYREITVPYGWGRFQFAREKDAREFAERRLREQYGDDDFSVQQNPGLHQDNYEYVGVTII